MPLKLYATDKHYAEKLDQLLKKERAESKDVADVVSKIANQIISSTIISFTIIPKSDFFDRINHMN